MWENHKESNRRRFTSIMAMNSYEGNQHKSEWHDHYCVLLDLDISPPCQYSAVCVKRYSGEKRLGWAQWWLTIHCRGFNTPGHRCQLCDLVVHEHCIEQVTVCKQLSVGYFFFHPLEALWRWFSCLFHRRCRSQRIVFNTNRIFCRRFVITTEKSSVLSAPGSVQVTVRWINHYRRRSVVFKECRMVVHGKCQSKVTHFCGTRQMAVKMYEDWKAQVSWRDEVLDNWLLSLSNRIQRIPLKPTHCLMKWPPTRLKRKIEKSWSISMHDCNAN